MGTKKSNKLYAAAAALAVTASAVAPGLSADAATKVTVKSVVNPASISHYGGYANSVKKLSLPKTVKVMLSNKKTENRSVKWGKVAYDAKYVGKYQTITGTVSGTSLKATIKVKLNNYPVDVVEPKLAPVAVGEDVKLPSTITVKYKNGNSIARSIKSFTISKADTSKAGKMKLSYSYKGSNLEIKGSIAYEVKAAEITNVMDSVKEDTLSVSADVKYPAKGAKAQLLIFAGKDESKGLAPIEGKIENGKFMAEGKMIPDGTHSYKIKVGDVVSAAKEFKVDNAVKLDKVSASGAKVLKVSFTGKPFALKAEDFSVKKGEMKSNIAKVTINETDKTALIELTSKLTKGDYSVAVAQGEKPALTGSVSVEDEKVEKIEILSTSAPLFDTDGSTGVDGVKVGYKIVNQYGEDITKVTSVTATASTGSASASNGVVTIASPFKEGDKTTLTLVQPESAKTVTATLTASAESKAAEVSVVGLYNADKKSLSEDTNLSRDTFYLEVTAKDQYGSDITSASKLNSDLIINETNPNVVDVAATFTEITVDGKKKLVLAVSNPTGSSMAVSGESTVTLISKATGKNVQYAIKVAEAKRADVVNLSQPNLVVAGEDAYVPAEVLDKDGKAITDIKVLNDAVKGVKVTLGSTAVQFVEKDGGVFVKLPLANLTNEGPVALVAVSSTTKVKTLTLNVKAAAKPVIVTGLSKDFGSTFKSGQVKNVTSADVLVEDQYGRVMSEAKLNAWLNASTSNKIVLTEDEASSIVSVPNGAPSEINASTDSVAVTAGSVKGSETLTVKLQDTTGVIASSAKDVAVRVTDGTEYKAYEVGSIGTIYDEVAAGAADNVAYDKAVKVYGILNDGSKVELAPADFSVSSSNTVLDADVQSDQRIDVAAAYTTYGDANEIKLPLTVTINATGEKLNQEVTLSKVKPKVTKLTTVTEGQGPAFVSGGNYDVVEKFNYDALTNGVFNFTDLDRQADVVATDQYGKSVVLDGGDTFADGTAIPALSLTFTKVNGELTFAANGSTSAAVNEIANEAAFNTVVTVGAVNSAPVKVTAVSAYSLSTNVATAKSNLDLTVANANSATSTITLPATQNGATVTWVSAGTGGSISGNTFTTSVRTSSAQTATLTATITKDGASMTQTFTVNVASDVDADNVTAGTQLGNTTVTKN